MINVAFETEDGVISVKLPIEDALVIFKTKKHDEARKLIEEKNAESFYHRAHWCKNTSGKSILLCEDNKWYVKTPTWNMSRITQLKL